MCGFSDRRWRKVDFSRDFGCILHISSHDRTFFLFLFFELGKMSKNGPLSLSIYIRIHISGICPTLPYLSMGVKFSRAVS